MACCSEKRPVKFENDDYEGLFELIVKGSEEYSGIENLGFYFDANMSYFFILDFSEDIYADTLNTRMSALKSLRLSTNTNLTERCRLNRDGLNATEKNEIKQLEEDIRASSLSEVEKEDIIKICEEIQELIKKIEDVESSIKAGEKDEEKQKTINSYYNDIKRKILDIVKKLDPKTRERDETIERKSKMVGKIKNTNDTLNNITKIGIERKSRQ